MSKRDCSHLKDAATKRLSKYRKVTKRHIVAPDESGQGQSQSSTSKTDASGLKRFSRGTHKRGTFKSVGKTVTQYNAVRLKAVQSGRSDAYQRFTHTRISCGKGKINTVSKLSNDVVKRIVASGGEKVSSSSKCATERTSPIRTSKLTPCSADKRRITERAPTHTYNLRRTIRGPAVKRISGVTVIADTNSNKATASQLSERTGATAKQKSRIKSRTFLATAEAVAKKVRDFKVKTMEDNISCWITGIAVTRDGQILLVDRNNHNVKKFSQSMELQSVLKLTDSVWGITIVDDNVAVVGLQYAQQILLLDFSDKALKIIRRQKLSFMVFDMCKYMYKDKLIAVTRESSTGMGVKMFDLNGKLYWSVSVPNGISYPVCVATQGNMNARSVIVTDQNLHALILIDSNTGHITRKVELAGKGPQGVTSDQNGTIYVCCFHTRETIVLTDDLNNERVLISKREKLREHPQAIAYDNSSRCLVVSYMTSDFVDIFKIP